MSNWDGLQEKVLEMSQTRQEKSLSWPRDTTRLHLLGKDGTRLTQPEAEEWVAAVVFDVVQDAITTFIHPSGQKVCPWKLQDSRHSESTAVPKSSTRVVMQMKNHSITKQISRCHWKLKLNPPTRQAHSCLLQSKSLPPWAQHISQRSALTLLNIANTSFLVHCNLYILARVMVKTQTNCMQFRRQKRNYRRREEHQQWPQHWFT